MPRTVQEIMNRELLAIPPAMGALEARDLLRTFRIGAAPVVDDEKRPIGLLSLREPAEKGGVVGDRMKRPAACVPVQASIDDAARLLASMDTHHLVVVDSSGVAIGMLSVLDVLRALLDLPARHPETFPHWDQTTGVSWTDDWPLEQDAASRAPAGAGVLALTVGHLGDADSLVWAESCADGRERVQGLSRDAKSETDPALARALALRGVRFRAATVNDESAQRRIVSLLRDRIAHVPPAGAT
jgi:CBS domain-containing protein